ncbi:hypothetical protein EIB75_10565 [Epilithonimonas vandammei]|uniref:Uncharacterized protein n=1 Tax=Epilithonimonas vandammei TaxID=2487072 RepID=A0A3G8ZB36_9FLAO|nr:hypothetical protein [Epilithonimonas vandammei]AZI53915.1 hypothetical protein EIB75_00975 [Epilithonimonas vandammei]AZI55665.1 hypothetical protein EIB75_10565 [Epilithonimonas vandammei]
MTNLTCEFTDINGSLAIRIKAINASAGDKILLDDILEGRYGLPNKISGKTKGGQASELLMEFNKKFDVSEYINAISTKPIWKRNDVIYSKVQRYRDNEAGAESESQIIMPSRRQKLFFEIPGYEEIKSFSPHIIPMRYAPAKSRGSRGNNSPAGFKKIVNGINRIPVTGEITEIDFEQEKFFKVQSQTFISGRNIKQSGKKSTIVGIAIFNFCLELTIGDRKIITEPIVSLNMLGIITNVNNLKKPDMEKLVIPNSDFFVAISYKQK